MQQIDQVNSQIGFNPSRGIAIIQTPETLHKIKALNRFNPSRGIAIIQTVRRALLGCLLDEFQSLTRDSNHSNRGMLD